jgi:hypothetical protein
MKNVSTGFGLCIVGLGIAAWPVLDRLVPQASAIGLGPVAPAVVAAALAQDPPPPTIVWYQSMASDVAYGTGGNTERTFVSRGFWLVRAWSDGKVEARWVETGGTGWGVPSSTLASCNVTSAPAPCIGPWVVINNPAEGYTFQSDANGDGAVDGIDLGVLLAAWGPVSRNPVPPSDCPLAMINP